MTCIRLTLEVSGSRMHPFSDGVLITFGAEAYADNFPAELRIRGVARTPKRSR